jgi:hypothetical protein
MKRLAVLSVVLVVLGVCVPSYAYVLVYDVFGTVRAVDIEADDVDRTTVRGSLVVDINEDEGMAVSAELVLYGRDAGNTRVYIVTDAVNMALYNSQGVVVMDDGQGVSMVMTGQRARRVTNIGLSQGKRVISVLDGSILIRESALFDVDRVLFGSGSMSAMINLQQTRSANRATEAVSSVVDDIIGRLEARGYTALGPEEPPPLPG